jgi:holo-[acyl-carrier protein] synthase
MILGVGIDLVAISRIETILGRFGARFEAKVFTDGEREACRGRGRPAQHFAARFAAKEAALKALGVPPDLRWHELEVVASSKGAPSLVFSGEARAAADRIGATRLHLTLTHAEDMAGAVVILES